MRKDPKRRGEMVEIAFLHRATDLGFRVSKPFGDSDPYDFIVDNGRRRWLVQVKSSGKFCAKNVYHVNAGRHTYAGRRAVPQLVPYLPEEIHFLAVLIVPEDTWYIIPIQALDGRVSLRIHSPNHPRKGDFAPYAEAWHLLTGGSSRSVRPIRPRCRPTPKRGHKRPLWSAPQTHLTSKRSSHPGAPGSRRPLSLTWEPIRPR